MSHISQISVVIVDDIPIVRYGLHDFLDKQNGILIKAEVGSEEEAVYAIYSNRPDIVILEKSIFCSENLATVRRLAHQYGGKLLAYTSDSNRSNAQSFLDQGGKGVVYKLDPLNELTDAIQALTAGRVYISSSLRRPNSSARDTLTDRVKELSRREVEIAKLVADGYTSPEIAEELCISRRTVENHRHRLMKKLEINSRSELVALMRSNSLIS